MKPFNQSLFCRLIIGFFIGKGYTYLDEGLKVMYEILAGAALVTFSHCVLASIKILDYMLGSSKEAMELLVLISIWNLISITWLIWYTIVQLGKLLFSIDEYLYGFLGIAITALLYQFIIHSVEFEEEAMFYIFFCFFCATLPPSYGLWVFYKKKKY